MSRREENPWVAAIRRDRKATAGFFIVLFFLVMAIIGPFLAVAPDALVGVPLQGPSWEHPLGTTVQGQDV